MGTVFAFICACFASSKDLVSKRLSFNVDGTVSAFGSFFFALPYYAVALVIAGICDPRALDLGGSALMLILLRSVTDTFAELTKMHALMFADVSLIACTYVLLPIFLLIVSPIITGDPLTKSIVVAVLFIALGSFVLGYRGGASKAWAQRKGLAYAALSAFFFALNNCCDRLAVQRTSPVMSGFTMTLLSAIFLYPLLRRSGGAPLLTEHRRPFLIRGFFEVGFMISKLTALQYLSAPVVAGIMKSSLLLTIVGGRVVFNESDFARRLIAGVFVVAGIVILLIK